MPLPQVKPLADLLESRLNCSRLSYQLPLSDYTTLRLGGPAELFCEIADETDAAICLQAARTCRCPVLVMGKGSNLLIPDEGFRGLVLHFGELFSDIMLEKMADGSTILTAQAGASLSKIASFAAEESLTGLEFAGGIPGSVGGSVTMNAGAYGGSLDQVLDNAVLLRWDGTVRRLSVGEMHMGYRHSVVMEENPSPIVLSAGFRLQAGQRESIRSTMQDLAARRREKQPLRYPSCGSTFKRPEGAFAGALIEQCGLKGLRIGGCSVSELHAGFLLNDQNGTAADYLKLIRTVQQTVLEKTGFALEPEVRIIRNEERSFSAGSNDNGTGNCS